MLGESGLVRDDGCQHTQSTITTQKAINEWLVAAYELMMHV